MKIETQTIFETRKKTKVCIYLEKEHFTYLQYIARRFFDNNYSFTMFYLITKYILDLHNNSVIMKKRTFTTEYQPKGRQYKRYTIWIEPTLWDKLNKMRTTTGYSISFLIRILLEWELQEKGFISNPLIRKSHVSQVVRWVFSFFSRHATLHNYGFDMRVDATSRFVWLRFWDYFT